MLLGQLNWISCVQRSTCTSCRTPPSAKCHANPVLYTEADITNKSWLPRQRPLRDRETSSDHLSAAIVRPTRQHLVKISPLDVKMLIGLTKIAQK